MKVAFILAIALAVTMVAAHCPNGCSGHGTCGANDVCTCFANFQGGDCSQRICAYDTAWVATPTATNMGHYAAECSNKGICNRETGSCECFDGFEGKACKRNSCPNDCSGNGVCSTIEDLSTATYSKRTVDPVTRAGAAAPTYTLWDEGKSQGCICDAGFEGADCSLRICPKGDDPLTATGSEMRQLLYIRDDGSFGAEFDFILTYFDLYGGAWQTQPIVVPTSSTGTAVATNVQAALRALPHKALAESTASGITAVDVTAEIVMDKTVNAGRTAANNANQGLGCDTAKVVCTDITFTSGPGTTGLQYLLECDVSDRNVAGLGFSSNSRGATADLASGCGVFEYLGTGTYAAIALTEAAECSNRGSCDTSTGQCECYEGFRGLACENQEALA